MNSKVKIAELMDESGVKFGTSGARGLVADMTDRVCYAYTLGFIAYLKNCWNNGISAPRKIAVAGDLRPSTDRIMLAVMRAAATEGLEVINCGKIPSSAVALYGMEEKIPAVMVTGSHIPADRNGIKYNTASGEILKADEQGIKDQVVEVDDSLFNKEGYFCGQYSFPEVTSSAKELYIERWLSVFPDDFLQGIKLGVYEHSAVGRDIMKDVYAALGAEIYAFARSDDFIPVDTEAVRPEDIALAAKVSSEHNLTAIVSTDGDSDRPLVSDEKGNWLRGDIAGILTADFLKADAVVTPVSSNTAVELCGKFSVVERSRIGSPFVIEIMQNLYTTNNSLKVVGYEANGGFLQMSPLSLFAGELPPLPTRDSVIVHLAVLGLAKKKGVKISELLEMLPERVSRSDRLQGVDTEISNKRISRLSAGGAEQMQKFLPELGRVTAIDSTDGLRMTFENTDIIHFRPSGNAPELRCYVEGTSTQKADWLLRYALDALRSWGSVAGVI